MPVDLVLMNHHHSRVSDSAPLCISYMCITWENQRKIMKNNTDYKSSVHLHHTLRTFNVDYYIVVYLKPSDFLRESLKNCTREAQDIFKFPRGSIQMLMWWISHRILALVAVLMLRIWFHIMVLLIPLIHSWMSLPTTFLLRAPHYLDFLQNYLIQ